MSCPLYLAAPGSWEQAVGATWVGFLEGFLSESVDLAEQPSLSEGKIDAFWPWGQGPPSRPPPSGWAPAQCLAALQILS